MSEFPFPARQDDDERHLTLEGEVLAVAYQDESSGFAVASLDTARGAQTVAGELAPVHAGERLRVHGQWQTHPRFGRQFKVAWAERVSPTTLAGLERYLAGGAVPGVGAEFARRLVAHFGERTLDALEAGEQELRTVPGIGPKRAAGLSAAFRDSRDRHRVLAELRGFGLGGGHAAQLYEAWKAGAIERVRRDPYALVGELRGVGFETAERIAKAVGIPPDSAPRARGVVLHLLREAAREGHACLPADVVNSRCEELGISWDVLAGAQEELVAGGRLCVEGGEESWLYLAALREAEQGVAEHVQRLLHADSMALASPELVLAAIGRAQFRPDESQRVAVEMALTHPFAVMTGGPGTGKTTTLRLLLEILEKSGCTPILLASPTGRAAKRLQEATGRTAGTVHRLLGYDPRTHEFRHDEDAPVEAGYLVVDEVSMLDLPLAHALLRAVPHGCRVLLVGDADQLPSVGPGSVLRDLVEAGTVPTTRLQRVHRQEEDSGITAAAHAVLEGRLPAGGGSTPRDDFFVVEKRDAAEAAEMVERLVAERIPRRYGLDPMREVLVVSPMYRGPLGVDELNARLGRRLNPGGRGAEWSGAYRAGDKVMVVRNDYDREVFNGDTGRVTEILSDEMLVEIDGRVQVYKKGQLDELVPAYCVTVHRAQGSEARAVVVVLGRSHYVMLRRNLLYTALTRGRELVVIVADPGALRRAVSNAEESRRHSRLAERLAAC